MVGIWKGVGVAAMRQSPHIRPNISEYLRVSTFNSQLMTKRLRSHGGEEGSETVAFPTAAVVHKVPDGRR